MSGNVIEFPLRFDPPPGPLTYTAALAGIAEALRQQWGVEQVDQIAALGDALTIVIELDASTIQILPGVRAG